MLLLLMLLLMMVMMMVMMMMMVLLLLLLLLRHRACRAYGCAWWRLLHLDVKNILGHYAKGVLRRRRWQSRTRLGWGFALDGVHRSIDVHRLGLTIVEVDGGELDLIDARQCGGVHLQRV
jgi:hypothetical protein